MDFLCKTLGLEEFLTQPVRTLSLGQRMRADLAASWLHNPKVLFLDKNDLFIGIFGFFYSKYCGIAIPLFYY